MNFQNESAFKETIKKYELNLSICAGRTLDSQNIKPDFYKYFRDTGYSMLFFLIAIILIIFQSPLGAEPNNSIIKLTKNDLKPIYTAYEQNFAIPKRNNWNGEVEKIFKEGKTYELNCPGLKYLLKLKECSGAEKTNAYQIHQ
jgi:hypothetical protein